MDSDLDSSVESDYTRPRVPRFVIFIYLCVISLQSFCFYSIWWRIVPILRVYYLGDNDPTPRKDPQEILPTVSAQIFIIANCMSAIFGGLVSDLSYTRYHVIFVTRILFALCLAFAITVAYFWDEIQSEKVRGGLIGSVLFVLASCDGISRTALFVFGIEQLNDETQPLKRQSFRRLVFWFFELGRVFAILLGILQRGLVFKVPHSILTGAALILLGSIVMIPLFVVCKRYYRYNELNAKKTFHNFRLALSLTVQTDEDFWTMRQEVTDNEDLCGYRRTLLRRYALLIVIFFTFGAFYTGDYFAGIIYPFQDLPDNYNPERVGIIASLAMLGAIPILEIPIRICRLYGNKANFFFIGIGMILNASSIVISEFRFDFSRNIAKTILSSSAQYFFYPAGYDLADIEAPATLRGTSTGLFLGLGTFLGAMIYFIWLGVSPAGVYPEKWHTARIVVCSVAGFALISFISLGFLYWRAKNDYYKARKHVESRHLEDSINHYGTFQEPVTQSADITRTNNSPANLSIS